MQHEPIEVLPSSVGGALADSGYWFLIGGQAVRCFAPYRPSRDADFGVSKAKDLKSLVALLRKRGKVAILETSEGTVHLNFEGVDVSVFVLPELVPHVEQNVLTVTGVLATKTHAILDRGTRRDFFDLYVMLQLHGLGILDCINALAQVYDTEVNHGLVLRALSYFEDAKAEAALPGEGKNDWLQVRTYFAKAVAALIVPPTAALAIQSRVVDVLKKKPTRRPTSPRPSKPRRSLKPPV